MAEGFEPSHGRINSAVPYQLGYATKSDFGFRISDCGLWIAEPRVTILTFTRETAVMRQSAASAVRRNPNSAIHNPQFFLEAMKGVEPLSSGLQDRRSLSQLSYIAPENLVDWEGFKPSQEVCRTSMLSVTSPAQ